MSLVTPVRRRQPVLVAAVLICAASMLALGAYRDGIRAAVTKEVPWRSRGRSGAGTRSA
jgi:hypothetical protein